jgi:hypothetical protein
MNKLIISFGYNLIFIKMKYKNLYTIRGDAVKSNLEDLKKTDFYYKQLVAKSPFVLTKETIILDTIGPKFKINDLCAKHQCPTKCPPCGSKNLINSVDDILKYLKTQRGQTDFYSRYKLKLPRQNPPFDPSGPIREETNPSLLLLDRSENI